MSTPFEDDAAHYLVLVNVENQHSLWSAGLKVPAGWNTTFGSDTRSACLDYVARNWTDMRPASLKTAMDAT
ncbi:MbtH family protein [Streptomyces decoyicus]|uniref:MbtH family protein n=1 Tax=Streptomyces decoyicus TaxID=249567 RepID=UPI0033ACC491